ncbi:hypothetical protein Poli38472_009797 [Pythium oligandrum]|uniref:FYVE-type domain-containing protein n=1 Tax=Pythium oligandrum TaxID=41045 RepID=A0A8K1CF39_PYTOL|nr:hypothetical protein Poli38472_009797 [Pythium oligandrum]|eukprot:TMW62304.1 hypothetical protein Poli38472_009797 [Pythium oligandrum]
MRGGHSLPTTSALSANVTSPPSSYQYQHPLDRVSMLEPESFQSTLSKIGTRARAALSISGRSHSHQSNPEDPSPRTSSQRSQAPTTPLSDEQDTVSSLAELSFERKQQLIEFIDQSVDDAYNLCHGFGRVKWQVSKNREGVTISRARSDDDTRLDAAVRGNCNVSATLDEMMDALITETTMDFVHHESTANPAEFLDGQVLYVLQPRTPENRFACVKWHCIKSQAPSVSRHRDYIYIELVDQFLDREGKRIGFRLCKSVELEELAHFDTSALFLRAKTLMLQTFTETITPGNLELYTMMINDMGERLPTWLVHKIVDLAALRSACIRDYISQRRMDMLVFARPKAMVPLAKRVCCIVCTKSFSLVRKKYNCVACGEVMCNQCSVQQFVAPQNLSQTVGKQKARICVKCSSSAQTRELPRGMNSVRMLGDLEDSGYLDSSRSSAPTSQSSQSSRGYPSERVDSEFDAKHRRNMRSVSTADVSWTHTGRTQQDQPPVLSHSASMTSRASIPHMFQFRPTSARQSGGKSSDRSSSTQASSSPDDGGGVDDEDDEDDEDYEADPGAEFEIQAREDSMDFGDLLDAAALTNGRFRQSYRTDDEDVLTDADEDEDLLSKSMTSTSTPATSPETLSPRPSLSTTAEALDIEEMIPQNDVEIRHRVTSDAVEEVTITRRAVVKIIPKRPTSNDDQPAANELNAPTSTNETTAQDLVSAVQRADSMRETVLAPKKPVDPSEKIPVRESEFIQLADLQVHIDRMTMISESLKNMYQAESEVPEPEAQQQSPQASVADQSAAISNLELRTQEEAALVADFRTAMATAAVSQTIADVGMEFATEGHSSTGSFEFQFREDSGISDYLLDSSFLDILDDTDPAFVGWKAVHSKTTGKVYYYNESCGTTSWTLPASESPFSATAYMVL